MKIYFLTGKPRVVDTVFSVALVLRVPLLSAGVHLSLDATDGLRIVYCIGLNPIYRLPHFSSISLPQLCFLNRYHDLSDLLYGEINGFFEPKPY